MLAVLVAVPHPGPEQDNIPDLQRLPAPAGHMGARPGHHEGDLDKTVRVQRMRLVVEVVTRVGERPLVEVQHVGAGVHREAHGHPGTVTPLTTTKST